MRGGLAAEENGTPALTHSPVREKMIEKRRRGTMKLIERERERKQGKESNRGVDMKFGTISSSVTYTYYTLSPTSIHLKSWQVDLCDF